MFLLDTNAVSESRKLATSNVDPVFKNWIDEIDPNLLYVSVISLMELEVGILRISRRDTRLNVPDPRPYQDAWIAATALVHGMTVVTRNVRDFVPMNVSLLCPFTQPH